MKKVNKKIDSKLKQKRLNHTNIIPFLSEILNHDNELDNIWIYGSLNTKSLIKILDKTNTVQSIYLRYKSVIKSSVDSNINYEINELKKTKTKNAFFRVQISFKHSFYPSQCEVIEYCMAYGIVLGNNPMNHIDLVNIKSWISKKIENEILNEIRGSKIENKAIFPFSYSTFLIPSEESNHFLEIFINQPYFNFANLSKDEGVRWTPRLFDLYKKRIKWSYFTVNKSINWTEELVSIYKDYIDWNKFSSIKSIIWTSQFVDKHKDYIDWYVFSRNESCNLTEGFIYTYKDYIDWNELSSIKSIKWTSQFVDKYKDYIDWYIFSRNESCTWTEGLIDIYKNYIDWNNFSCLKSIKWTAQFVDKYKDFICWSQLSSNVSVEWSEGLIHKYYEKLDFDLLMYNKSVIWGPDLIENFIDKVDFAVLAKHSNLTMQSVIKYDYKWNEFHHQVSERGRRRPDGSYLVTERFILWDYLFQNELIFWNENILQKYIKEIPLYCIRGDRVEVSVKFINDNWNFYKNELVSFSNSELGGLRTENKKTFLRDRLRTSKIIDLTINKFIDNEIKWWGVFCSEDFINSSIMELIVLELDIQKQRGT